MPAVVGSELRLSDFSQNYFLVESNASLLPIVCVAVCLAGTVFAVTPLAKPFYDVEDAENLFKDYEREHKKLYNRREYLQRFDIFKESLKSMNERNAKFPGTVFKVDHFADLRPEELEQYNGFKLLNTTIPKVIIPDSPVAAPDTLDWRDKQIITHVKNQGDCGSCYIFSAIANIEAQYALKHQQCVALSEGQALDCLVCGNCRGGVIHHVINEFATRAGIEKEEDYSYHPWKGECHEDASKVAVRTTKAQILDIPDEEVLKKKLADLGPLAVALNSLDFSGYGGGILLPHKCTGHRPNHGVLLVGYGEENGEKFWILKNSYGETWGEKGYVRLQRGVNACVMGTSYTANAIVQ